MTYVWAYCAGLLTLINPCVLPLLPVVLAASLQGSRFGPAVLAAGLTLSFAAVGVGVGAFGWLADIGGRMVAHAAAAAMILFGAVLLVLRTSNAFAMALSPLAGRADAGIGRVGRDDGAVRDRHALGCGLVALYRPHARRCERRGPRADRPRHADVRRGRLHNIGRIGLRFPKGP